MAPPLPPSILAHLPDLPCPPRAPIWHNNPALSANNDPALEAYTLSTHIIEAAPFRAVPEFAPLEDVSMGAHVRMKADSIKADDMKADMKARQKAAKENVDAMWDWKVDFDNRKKAEAEAAAAGTEEVGRAKKEPEEYERLLWICLNRYVRKDLNSDGRKKRKGLTIVLAHPLGCNKETWEPVIASLLKSPAGRDVEAVWVWENVDHGDSAILNAGKLNRFSDWNDSTRDLIHFLLHYLPSVTPSTLPVHLPRVSASEFEERIHRGFTNRKIVFCGHSIGGYLGARACYTYPQLFSGLVLADPGIVPRGHYTIKPTLTYMARVAFARQDTWNSKEEALATLSKNPFFRAWTADAIRTFVEGGLYAPSADSKVVVLKTHPVYEAFANICGKEACEDMFEKMPMLSEKVYIKWLLPDKKKGGGLAGVEASEDKIKTRPKYSDGVFIPGAGHMIPLEKPDEVARGIADTIDIVYGETVAKL